MMTREQVIKTLQGIRIALDMDGCHNDAQAVADALALLKADEAQRRKADYISARITYDQLTGGNHAED